MKYEMKSIYFPNIKSIKWVAVNGRNSHGGLKFFRSGFTVQIPNVIR